MNRQLASVAPEDPFVANFEARSAAFDEAAAKFKVSA